MKNSNYFTVCERETNDGVDGEVDACIRRQQPTDAWILAPTIQHFWYNSSLTGAPPTSFQLR